VSHALTLRESKQAHGWWCDGAFELSIRQTTPTSFLIVGAAIWAQSGNSSAPFYVAPFELEFHFASPGDLESMRIIVRFGVAEPSGDIRRVPYDAFAARIIQNRPKSNQDWALAIELS
jgi:hypothetical protein